MGSFLKDSGLAYRLPPTQNALATHSWVASHRSGTTVLECSDTPERENSKTKLGRHQYVLANDFNHSLPLLFFTAASSAGEERRRADRLQTAGYCPPGRGGFQKALKNRGAHTSLIQHPQIFPTPQKKHAVQRTCTLEEKKKQKKQKKKGWRKNTQLLHILYQQKKRVLMPFSHAPFCYRY